MLSIAGSDCSAGAGLQADLKTFQHFRVHGLTAVTSVVSEHARCVRGVHVVPCAVVEDQVSLMLDSFAVQAVKTGMLCTAVHVRAVAAVLAEHPQVPVVVDPVMVASTGDVLLEDEAVVAYADCLFPNAAVITPNLPEAERLLGESIVCRDDLEPAARALSGRYRVAVLLKGGHLPGGECVDVLVENGRAEWFCSARVETGASHGTGCTLSAAVAAGLARGAALPDAVRGAKEYLTAALERSYCLDTPSGGGIPVLNQGTDFQCTGFRGAGFRENGA